MMMKVTEKSIEAPWGTIALKLWGDESNQAVLTVHGIMDNAGSFDTLIPLLPQEYFYICVDLPGHGKSSHFPPHLPIHSLDYIIVYQLVTKYFKRNKYIIMGHSYGGQLGLIFAQFYPELVDKLIMFDTVVLFPIPTDSLKFYMLEKFKLYLSIEDKLKTGKAPQYTYEEALQRVMEGHPPQISQEAAVGILKRMLIAKDNGKFEFSLDQRLKNFINPIHDVAYAAKLIKRYPLQCPILIVFGTDNQAQREYVRPVLQLLQKQKNVAIKFVPGYHDVHNEKASEVAPHVVEFLAKKKSKL
ncbi:hypothetical protein GWI33_014960 [Rhynchophorus ferrugineus]|uniref:AB hydrolase-1 domain-containing protein n=1 Tax=Rhynchophorus ferrugineus TaxID=354439 RepID=A0A834M6E5_RHYFE|nr:hypothetical protein GWI33_014960 [Rhynchophorus ferrugineus]